ncbi:MAG: Hsp20/alpha crystallin family protein [Anaerococcus sp.]|jgi:HSP20 family protein|nr:Hsp20/alpha crystallin family protein [Peptoniphilaceae bacterium]MDY3054685.1 Hsp20/alpha crystallin family protein [Anaerococcus sp.]
MTNIIRKNNSLLNSNFRDFNNMIDSFFNDDFLSRGSVYESSFKVDVSEKDDSYLVEAEMPGFSKDDIAISLDEGKLVISAQKNEEVDKSDEDKNYIHKERKSSQMSRSMYFPDIDEDNIKASLNDGILEIELGKSQVKETKKHIAIE